MNPFKKEKEAPEIKERSRFTAIQQRIVRFLSKQPLKAAFNSDIADHCGKRTGHISSTLKVLEKKNFIMRPERNVSVYTGKKHV